MGTCQSSPYPLLIFSMPVTRKSKYTLIKQSIILWKHSLFSVNTYAYVCMYVRMYHGK